MAPVHIGIVLTDASIYLELDIQVPGKWNVWETLALTDLAFHFKYPGTGKVNNKINFYKNAKDESIKFSAH